MKIEFCIQGNGVMVDDLFFLMDWDCPFIPRIGEIINTGVFSRVIESGEFFRCLNRNEQKEWNSRKEEMAQKGYLESDANLILVQTWLDDMILKVKDVYWNRNNEGFILFIVVESDK